MIEAPEPMMTAYEIALAILAIVIHVYALAALIYGIVAFWVVADWERDDAGAIAYWLHMLVVLYAGHIARTWI